MNDARLNRDKAAYMKTPMVVRRSRSIPLASCEEEAEADYFSLFEGVGNTPTF